MQQRLGQLPYLSMYSSYTRTHIYTYINIQMFTCIYTRAAASRGSCHMHIYTVYTHTHARVYMYTYVYIYIYIYIHIYIYTYTYIHINIYRYSCVSGQLPYLFIHNSHSHTHIHKNMYLHVYFHTYSFLDATASMGLRQRRLGSTQARCTSAPTAASVRGRARGVCWRTPSYGVSREKAHRWRDKAMGNNLGSWGTVTGRRGGAQKGRQGDIWGIACHDGGPWGSRRSDD